MTQNRELGIRVTYLETELGTKQKENRALEAALQAAGVSVSPIRSIDYDITCKELQELA